MSDKTSSVEEAVKDYYMLKQKYEQSLQKQISAQRSKSFKKNIKKLCVNCGKTGNGTIFKREGRFLIAVCGASTPCDLNIKIDRGFYSNVIKQEKINAEKLNEASSEIIQTKLQMMHGQISKDTAIEKFNEQKTKVDALNKELISNQTTLKEIIYRPDKTNIINTATADISRAKDTLESLEKEWKENAKPEFAKDMVDLTVTTIMPLANKLTSAKYEKTYMDIHKDGITKTLIEEPYTLEQLMIPTDTPAKVIDFRL